MANVSMLSDKLFIKQGKNIFLFFTDHFPLLVELEMTPTVGTSNGLISRR